MSTSSIEIKIEHLELEEKFEDAIMSPKLVVIDFYAPWCQPCKVIAKDIKEFSQTYKDSVSFYKVSVDEYPDLADGVSGLPSFGFYKDGVLLEMVASSVREKIESKIKQYV